MIIYFLLVLVGSLIAGKLILGELRKEKRVYIPIASSEGGPAELPNNKSSQLDPLTVLAQHTDKELIERVNKVENLLAEKNAEIVKLNNILEAERRHKSEFEKIKSLLQWQIFESRQVNKQIKQELDSIKAQQEQFQQESSHLKKELNYKEQVLAQNEVKISELNNRLRNFLSVDPSATDTRHTKSNDPAIDSLDALDWRTKLTD